jgi:uncharacterized lipoprotein
MDLKRRQLIFVSAMLLASCVAYVPTYTPVVSQTSPQQRFDKSWDAANGAMYDQGLTITAQDRGAGVIQVKFASKGDDRADPGLIRRVSDSFDRRMGR